MNLVFFVLVFGAAGYGAVALALRRRGPAVVAFVLCMIFSVALITLGGN